MNGEDEMASFLKRLSDGKISRIGDGFPSVDSLGLQTISIDSSAVAPDYSDITKVFGTLSHSSEITPAHFHDTVDGLTANSVYQASVLVVLVVFGLLMIFYHKEMWQIFRMLGKKRIATRFSEDMGFLFSNLMRHVNALGFLLMAVATVKVLDINGFGLGNDWTVMSVLLVPAIAVAFTIVYFIQAGTLFAIGGLTFSIGFVERMIMLKRVVFAATAVLITPLVLLLAVNEGASEMTLYYAVISLVIAMMLLFAKKSLSLFIEQNVSILLWILYLCTVEAMPLAVLLTVMLRHN